MKRQRALAITAAGALASSFAVAFFASSSASADPLELKAEEVRSDLVGEVEPALVEAMSETFDLTASEVYDRLAIEDVASELLEEIPSDFSDSYAGLWLSEDAEEIMVATTSEADTDELEAEGATPVLVEHDMTELEAVTAAFDQVKDSDVYGYYIDVENNRVVVESPSDAPAAELIEATGVDSDMVAIDTAAEEPSTFAVVGGDAYTVNNSWRCSVGFAVTQGETAGFVTAGHCGSSGDEITGGNLGSGTFQESVFPGSDMAWATASTELTNTVNSDSGTVPVSDSDEAAVGASICRSGSTTGWHCGEVQALDQTVNYAEGTVDGLTQTSACAEPGDSGGSFIAGSSAQGMTSGGSGDCSAGGTTFFQPINPALDAWGLTLYTG